ncbi:MAG: response regulator [Chitinophagaceae bacterium]|nr:response regulator [Chitinophagaceae bacterium]
MNEVTTSSKVILVADDDIDDQKLISDSFMDIHSGCKTEVVFNGQQAIARLSNPNLPRPCLLILDLNMPIMGGMETLEHIRKNPAFDQLPVVVLTTDSSRESRNKTMTRGANDYVVKPNDYRSMMEISEKMLQWCK